MYNLGFQHYQSYFMFDLSKKEAKLISQGITQDNRKNLIYTSEENDNIAKSFIIPDKSFNLTKDQCNQIELEYEKFGYDSDDNIKGIWNLNDIFINNEYLSDEISWHNKEYVNRFPDSWIDFGKLLIEILGFDLLNINQKDLITELHYDIGYNGVYDKKNSNKLKLKKVNFHISNLNDLSNAFNFTISDDDERFSKVCELLEYYGIYKWYHKDLNENITKHDDFNDFNGNSWFLELIFEDGKVLNLRGDNAYPDTYIHLGQALLNLKKDYLKIGEIENKESLMSFGQKHLLNVRNEIKKIQIFYKIDFGVTLHNRFEIDCINQKLIPDTHYNVDFNNDGVLGIYALSLKNVPKNEISLDSSKFKDFLEEFLQLELIESKHKTCWSLYESFENSVRVTYPKGEVSYDFKYNPQTWIQLGKSLNKLVGFDILNIANSEQVITNLHYDFKDDGVYDKRTNKKLRLKSLSYRHGAVLEFGFSKYRFSVDFDKKTFRCFINEKELSDEELTVILDLIEKYHIYQLDDEKYWQKLIYHKWMGFDGYNWRLNLVFEDDKHWSIGCSNDYPDIFTHLAFEIIDLTGKDMLNVRSIGEEDLKLYKKYGNDILNG